MDNQPIVLYDNVCHLCDGAVKFIIKRDRTGKIKFASLQSDLGQSLLKKYNIDSEKSDSVVLVQNEKAYTESTAALRICRHLDGLWPLLSAFLILPTLIRNPIYRFVARNRYKWFGKADQCIMPGGDIRSRFLEI